MCAHTILNLARLEPTTFWRQILHVTLGMEALGPWDAQKALNRENPTINDPWGPKMTSDDFFDIFNLKAWAANTTGTWL